MSNYTIKINLMKLNGAFLTNIKGRTSTKSCIVIPVDDSDLFVGEKGCYLDMAAIETSEPKYGDTHMLKKSLSKELYQSLSEEERRAFPILGSMKPMEKRQPVQAQPDTTIDMSQDYDYDLPF